MTTAMERLLPASAFDTGNTAGVKFHGATDFITHNQVVFKSAIDADDNHWTQPTVCYSSDEY